VLIGPDSGTRLFWDSCIEHKRENLPLFSFRSTTTTSEYHVVFLSGTACAVSKLVQVVKYCVAMT